MRATPDIVRLTYAYLANDITPTELEQLNELLRQDESARSIFVRFVCGQVNLRCLDKDTNGEAFKSPTNSGQPDEDQRTRLSHAVNVASSVMVEEACLPAKTDASEI